MAGSFHEKTTRYKEKAKEFKIKTIKNTGKILRYIFWQDASSLPEKFDRKKILPPSTGDALNTHRSGSTKEKPVVGYLKRQDIKNLIEFDYWTNPLIYIGTKALHEHIKPGSKYPLLQSQFLSEVVDASIANPSSKEPIQTILKRFLPYYSDLVQAGKLDQLNRTGVELWDDEYSKLARDLIRQDMTPVLTAYASLTGIRPFISEYMQHNRQQTDVAKPTFQILIGKALIDNDITLAGYNIYLERNPGQRIEPIFKAGYQRPDKPFIIDDTGRDIRQEDHMPVGDFMTVWEFIYDPNTRYNEALGRVIMQSRPDLSFHKPRS